ncbi:MAG: guanylate kinase [Endomicrobiia bacterium]
MKLLKKYINQYKSKIKKGKVIVISAPSGAGKTTVCKELLKRNKDIVFSVSYTTREKRSCEVDGKDYYFVSEKKFFQMVKQNKFIEWAKVHNHFYGTPKDFVIKTINSSKNILLDIDVQGGKNIRKIFPEGIFIFILPPSVEALKKRIISRGEDDVNEINTRLENVDKELKYISFYDYIVINDKLEETVKIIENIISANKYKIKIENRVKK